MHILVLNAGSSSLKASIVDPGSGEVLHRADERTGDRHWPAVVGAVLDALDLGDIGAVGHRVVHGGVRFRAPTVVDDDALKGIEALADLAPLHNPIAVETIRFARERLPSVPQVACFDTAFHATLQPAEYRYAVPDAWFRDWGVRRFGFHGLSVEWSIWRAAELLERDIDELNVVVAHLGSGCSVTAVQGRRSVSTSMGMTPLEGLVMGTRAGSIDPGVLLHVLRDGRLTRDELVETLEHRSGLLAMAGTADMRAIVDAEARGDGRAAMALQMFVRRAAAGIAGAATALRSIDAVIFTGGIGEHAGSVRAAIVGRLGVLGIAAISGEGVAADALLSAAGARPAVLRIEAREDLVIAAQTASAIGFRPGAPPAPSGS